MPYIKKDSTSLTKIDTSEISLKYNTGQRDSLLPMFHVNDVRYDTFDIGTHTYDNLWTRMNRKRIKLTSGTAKHLEDYLNSFGTKNRDDSSLYCFIKTFRFTELDSFYSYKNGLEKFTKLNVQFEVYFKTLGKLFPAFRVDTVLYEDSYDKSPVLALIKQSTDLLKKKAIQLNTSSTVLKKSYAFEEVMLKYGQRFKVSIIKDSAYKKGIYTTFSEFKNNSPTITEYEWKADRANKVLYIKDGNQNWIAARKNIFGFSDGKYLWVKAKSNFYPLYKKGNTFEFFGSLYLREITKSHAPTYFIGDPVGTSIVYNVLAMPLNNLDKVTNRSIYELNMDNGEFQ